MKMSDRGAGQSVTWTVTAAASTGAWIRVKPFRGSRAYLEGKWGSATTVGCAVRVEGILSSQSTTPVLIARIKSTQKSVQIASTSGVTTKVFQWVRVKTSAGVFSTGTKSLFLTLLTVDTST